VVSRSEPQVFSIHHQPAEPVGDPGLAQGCRAHSVSRDEGTAAYTVLAHFDPGWGFEGEPEGVTELFVLEGALAVGDWELSSGHYCQLPSGGGVLSATSPRGATAFVIWSPALGNSEQALASSSFALPWESTVLPGFPAGAMHKSLRPGDLGGSAHGGPNGFLRLVLTPPGWLSPREERHVDCWEENILLRGDMLMPGRGTIRSGDCLANPPGFWHGPMVTKGGALFLVNCDAPMPVEYRDHPPGPRELERYLETAPWS